MTGLEGLAPMVPGHGGEAIDAFVSHVDEVDLRDLRERLRETRLPDAETVGDWSQGVPIAQAERLRAHWLDRYDWRRCEADLNGLGQYRTRIEGLGIHFLHIRSPEPAARPLLLVHGWPGSILQFRKAIGPLTDPAAHGVDPRDAFHLVIPSLPGFSFSDHPAEAAWTVERIADAWLVLMGRLGYRRFFAHGGGRGAEIAAAMASAAPDRVAALHLASSVAGPARGDELTAEEQAIAEAAQRHRWLGRGYWHIQSTRPQTLGYVLADSPLGQAAWIYEKFREWSDCGNDPASVLALDDLLDTITLYWLANAGASSARLDRESRTRDPAVRVKVPVGISLFPKEPARSSRRFAARLYPRLAYWNEPERGGHFAALEVPDLFVAELRACFRATEGPDA